MTDSDLIEDGTEEFHRGESSPELSPADAVALFVASRSQGVLGEVEATVVLADGLKSFKKKPAKLKIFLDGLCDANVLSLDEAKALTEDKSAPKVSKLTKIAEYRDELLDDEIRARLTPGYTCLYEVALLIEEVFKGQQGLDIVGRILSECDGEITKAWVSDQRKKVRKDAGLGESSKEDKANGVADIDPDDAPSTQAEMPEEPIDTHEPDVDRAKRMVAALLITASNEEVDRFDKELADAVKSRCVKISGEIDANAVLLIDATAKTLLSMSAIIGSLGFSRCVQVGLLSEPVDHDLAPSRIMAVFVRGSIELAPFKHWQIDASSAALAGRLLEDVSGRRVHLFADAETDGWESVVGEANWQK